LRSERWKRFDRVRRIDHLADAGCEGEERHHMLPSATACPPCRGIIPGFLRIRRREHPGLDRLCRATSAGPYLRLVQKASIPNSSASRRKTRRRAPAVCSPPPPRGRGPRRSRRPLLLRTRKRRRPGRLKEPRSIQGPSQHAGPQSGLRERYGRSQDRQSRSPGKFRFPVTSSRPARSFRPRSSPASVPTFPAR
jgi:hypothetical protein